MKFSTLFWKKPEPTLPIFRSGFRALVPSVGLIALAAIGPACVSANVFTYPYAPYNEGKMDPVPLSIWTLPPGQTQWQLSDAQLAYITPAEYLRYPGKEPGGGGNALLDLVPVTPNTPFAGYINQMQATINPLLANFRNTPLDILLVGDSIISQWGGGQMGAFGQPWLRNFGEYGTVNLGIGGDRTSGILWRLDRTPFGELKEWQAGTGRRVKVCVLQIGNNNQYYFAQGVSTPANVQGVVTCLRNLRIKFPETPIVWVNLFPVTSSTNTYLKILRDALNDAGINTPTSANFVPNVHPLDIWDKYASANGVSAEASYFYDGVHPSDAGYQVWADNMKPVVLKLLSPTVTYAGNGNISGGAPQDAANPYSIWGSVTVLGNTGNLAKTSHSFVEWNTAPDGSGTPYAPGASFSINQPTTLYAQWRFDGPFTLTYNANAATGGTAPVDITGSYLRDSTVNVATNTGSLVRSGGFAFDGWNTKADGSGLSFAVGSPLIMTAHTVLYAKWRSVAVTQTWTGGGTSGNWTVTANWASGLVPPGDGNSVLSFGTSNRTTSINNSAADTPYAGITFASNSPAYTLQGSRLKLAGRVAFEANPASAVTQTISAQILLDGPLQIGTTANGRFSLSGNISGSFGITKTGTGTLTLSGANSYTGTTQVEAGDIIVGSADNRLPTSGVLTLGSSLSTARLVLGAFPTGRAQTLAAIQALNTGSNVVGGGNATTSPATLTLSPPLGSDSVFSGKIGGDTATQNGVHFVKIGAGNLTLTGSGHSYTGNTSITDGILINTGKLPATTVSVTGNGTLAARGLFGGNVSLTARGTLLVELAATSSTQTAMSMNGTLNLGDGHRIRVQSSNNPAPGDYIVATAAGGLTGNLGLGNVTLGVAGAFRISGNQLIFAVPTQSAYDIWKTSNGVLGGALEDDDNDGMVNFLEFALGGNPKQGSSALVRLNKAPADNLLALSFRRRSVAAGSPTLTFEYSTTLDASTWQAFQPERVDVSVAGDFEDVQVVPPANLRVLPRLFLRLKATQ